MLYNPKPVPDITISKAAAETVNNSAALQDDNELAGISLLASTLYWVRVLLKISSNATADFKMDLVTSQNVNMAFEHIGFASNGAGRSQYFGNVLGTSFSTKLDSDGTLDSLLLEGWIKTINACTLKLQWAQNTANASDTKVLAASRIEITSLELS